MGDVVFAPLYEVLRRRGVRFEFFHRLENVRLADRRAGGRARTSRRSSSTCRPRSAAARVPAAGRRARSAVLAGASRDWTQLVDGERLRAARAGTSSRTGTGASARRTILRVGRRLRPRRARRRPRRGAARLPRVCRARSPLARDGRPREDGRDAGLPDLAAGRGLAALGWTDRRSTLSGFVEPFDTWADMRHLLPREAGRDAPRGPGVLLQRAARPPTAPRPRRRRLSRAAARAVRRNAVRVPRAATSATCGRARVRRAGRVPLGSARRSARPARRRTAARRASTRSSGPPT